MEGYEKVYNIIKSEEEKSNEHLSFFTMNNIIFEDNPNKKIKIYDSSLFDKMKVFSIENNEEIEFPQELIHEEKNKIREKEKLEFQSYISMMKNFLSDIEKNTNEIRVEMELDQKKKEEMAKIEKQRLENERRIKEEQEKKIKEEQERLIKERQEKERLQKIKEEQERQNNNINGLDNFNNSGRNIKERLINAGKNFENIKKEANKIALDGTLRNKTFLINKNINDIIINKTTSIKNLDMSIKELNNLLKEIKEINGRNNQELYLYACYTLLIFIFKKLNEVDSEIIYENILINAKIIFSLKCKTLTYMFFQRISNKCPYVIPLPYKRQEHEKIFKNVDLNEVHKLCRNAEYIYFTFLYLDINTYIKIIENYISNIELFSYKDINFLISNSFYCFMDVFGEYIFKNKTNWINRILKIKENVMKGIKEEENKVKGTESHLVSINKSINLNIENCFNKLRNNRTTKFSEQIKEISSK